jgi:hypothetical protein
MQQASFQNTGQAANAFGMAGGGMTGMEGMPQAQQFAGGVSGYSSAPMFQETMAALEANNPGQFAAIQNMFIDPQTGDGGYRTPAQSRPVAAQYGGGNNGRPSGGVGGYNGGPAPSGGGFTSIGDMFDGGGAGSSGRSFSGGGLISSAANKVSSPRGSSTVSKSQSTRSKKKGY